MFKPLIDALFDAVPVAWDMYSNFIYRLVTGRKFEDTIEVLEGDIMEVENIVKYEYIPTEEIKDMSKEMNVIKFIFIEGEKEGIKACIGYDIEGNLKNFDMLEGHAIVGGASRWGKSSFLNVFITNITKTYTRNEVCFLGCDYKKADVYYFRNYNNFLGMSTNKKEFMDQMKWLEKEMSKRADILDEANCRNVINYNKKHDTKISYIIVVIDELIQVVSDKDCKDKLHLIMSKCASYGIYFLLATQDCTKETIGRCKMNCSQIVGFHTFDQTDSDTLIGKGYDLQDINVKGRCKIKNSEGIVETQIFYLEEDEIEEMLKPYLNK
ncbi:FtsK/SpoIIIE domain-containing protein [Dialister succinatiphilus]|uniref:FtsK/SpoIIIE domain-containing protein n=1 Tax=Dialister succinatiphilus TaxID=487173 RepID=UPI003F8181FE